MKPDRAWNSTFPKRKTPFRNKQPWRRKAIPKDRNGRADKNRPALKKVSKAREKANARYLEIRRDFLRENPICKACIVRGITPGVPNQVHHSRGRVGRLLCDVRFFIAVCEPCHHFIHFENPKLARELGLLAEGRDWNRFPEAEKESAK